MTSNESHHIIPTQSHSRRFGMTISLRFLVLIAADGMQVSAWRLWKGVSVYEPVTAPLVRGENFLCFSC